MNKVLHLFDEEDITYLKEQEKLLNACKTPLLNALKEIDSMDLSLFEPKEKFDYYKHSLYNEVYVTKTNVSNEIRERINQIGQQFVNVIKHYLENKYSIKLKFSLKEPFNFESLSLQNIYEILEEELNGMDFQEKSLECLKKDMQSFASDLSLSGRVLEIKNRFHHNFFGYHLSSDARKNLKTLFKGLCYFETGQPGLSENMNTILDFGWKEGPLGLEKALKFKIFKNGKLSLTFKTKEDAESFLTFFSLSVQ
jgi:D-ribose pyranose/furanose isomerase RbsD